MVFPFSSIRCPAKRLNKMFRNGLSNIIDVPHRFCSPQSDGVSVGYAGQTNLTHGVLASHLGGI